MGGPAGAVEARWTSLHAVLQTRRRSRRERVTPRTTLILASLVVALGRATLLLGQPATPESLRDVVVASNGLIEQANALRAQAAAGQITVAEARAEVTRLLPAFDESVETVGHRGIRRQRVNGRRQISETLIEASVAETLQHVVTL